MVLASDEVFGFVQVFDELTSHQRFDGLLHVTHEEELTLTGGQVVLALHLIDSHENTLFFFSGFGFFDQFLEAITFAGGVFGGNSAGGASCALGGGGVTEFDGLVDVVVSEIDSEDHNFASGGVEGEGHEKGGGDTGAEGLDPLHDFALAAFRNLGGSTALEAGTSFGGGDPVAGSGWPWAS